MKANDKSEYLFGSMRVLENRGEIIDSGIELSHGSVQCFKSANGEIGLLIPLSEKAAESFKPDKSISAIHLVSGDNWTSTSIKLVLKDASQEEIFFLFVDEVLAFLGTLESEDAVANEVARYLEKWRRFFKTKSSKGLSKEAEVGLLCELELLKSFLDSGREDAVNAWIGPDKEHHDFDFDDLSVECKATRSSESMTVTIHGDDQLIPRKDKRLCLVIRRYQPDSAGSLHLLELIKEITGQLTGDVAVFLDKLDQNGIDVLGIPAEQFTRYEPIETLEFDLVDGFPHLVVKDPLDRITSINYSLNLAGADELPGFHKEVEFF